MLNQITPEAVTGFMQQYAELLREFQVPDTDFPLKSKMNMAAGAVAIFTNDDRFICGIQVEGDMVTPATPVGPAATAYARLFTKLANDWFEFKKQIPAPESNAEEDEKYLRPVDPNDLASSPGYYQRHACCPVCYSQDMEQTTIGCLLGYDTNAAHCICGWKGIVHDLIAHPRLLIDSIAAIYERSVVGGPLHVVLDDGNVEAESIQQCLDDCEKHWSVTEDPENAAGMINLVKTVGVELLRLPESHRSWLYELRWMRR